MFVILVYDVGVERVNKVLRICREYLTWVQNSVFEGEISEAKLRILWKKLEAVINKKHDSILIYAFRTTRYSEQLRLGIRKGGDSAFL